MEVNSKKCFKCSQVFPLSEYYKHPKTADGHLNKCKTCTKRDTNKREKELRKDPLWVEEEKIRAREKYHRLNYKEKHKPTTEKKRVNTTQYRNKYPEKYSAKNKTQHLHRKEGVELHHWSYNKEHYKDVIPLSVKDHAKIHRYLEYDKNSFKYIRKDTGELLETREKHLEYISWCIENKE